MKVVPEYNVLLLMNNCSWIPRLLQNELEAIKSFYAKGDGINTAKVTFFIHNTSVTNIKWNDTNLDTKTGLTRDKLIDRAFYDQHFVKEALRWGWKKQQAIDILCVVLPSWQIETRTTRGACDWGGTNAGMVECWIAGEPNDGYYYNGTLVVSAIQANLAHELKHAMHFFNGTPDTTHRLINRQYGNYPLADDLSGIRATQTYTNNKSTFRYWRNYFRQIWALFS